MNRYEYSAYIVVVDENDKAAYEKIMELLFAANKDPDGPRVYLDDGKPYVSEVEDDLT